VYPKPALDRIEPSVRALLTHVEERTSAIKDIPAPRAYEEKPGAEESGSEESGAEESGAEGAGSEESGADVSGSEGSEQGEGS
jgi:hypothetical protein